MVKKLQKKSANTMGAGGFNPAAMMDKQVAQNVRDSAQQIWAAGLAAFSKAQGEGSKVFDTLVKEGMSLQKKTQNLAEQKISAVANKMTGMAGDVGAKAGQHWDKLESIFEERVSRALKSLGVPSGADIGSLIARIDTLAAAVGMSSSKKAGPAAPVKAPVKKAAAPAKKAVAKKAAPVKKAVAPKKAAPKKAAPVKAATKAATKAVTKTVKRVSKAAEKPVAEAKVAAKRAPRQAKAAVAAVTEAAKDAVQA